MQFKYHVKKLLQVNFIFLSVDHVSEDHLKIIRTSMESIAPDLINAVENFYQYIYDEQFYKISYELQEMYNPWGNQVQQE